MNVKVYLSKDENEIAEAFAQSHNSTVEEEMKRVFFEKIEKEYGVTVDK